ncbi:MAG: PRC-barrel domain-containing protein [Pseudorhizobium sp.]
MKMFYITALMAGTALMPLSATAQESATGANAPNNAAQSGQTTPGMSRVQMHIQQAMQALEENDMQAAREAVQEARRSLNQNRQSAAMNGLRQPLQQADQALAQQDEAGAERALVLVEEQFVILERESAGADVVVEEGEAAIRVQVPEPDVTVQQANPRVAVQQNQPEIVVYQPAPVVTVDIPQPRITVRIPQPDVNVSQAQPQVQVEQGQPQVRVSESEPQVRVQEDETQANVQVQRSGQPVVRIQDSEQQANVRYEAEEAQVRVNRAEGEPEVRFEETEQAATQQRRTEETAAANAEVDQENTAAIAPREGVDMAVGVDATRDVSLTVADIKDYDIVGANGNDLGDIEDVVTVNNRLYAVVTSGGFLGLGEERAAVPLSSLYVTDEETLLGPNVTQERIDGLANFDSTRYPNLPDDHPVTLGAR